MSAQDDKVHKQIVNGLNDMRVSPAVLALLMTKENANTNTEMFGYFVNYVNTMAHKNIVPLELADIQLLCRYLTTSLEELGLIGEAYGNPAAVDNHEYIAI